jgi:hypothetical protein
MNALVLVLLGSFAAIVTLHVSMLLRLASCPPRRRALAALLVPPLAPFWTYRNGQRGRALVWMGLVAVYALTLVLSTR